MADRNMISVNGRDVEIPDVLSFDLDEATILYDYTGLSVDQIDETTGAHPGLLKALLHVAVRRVTPGATAAEITEAVGKVKLTDYMDALRPPKQEEKGDALPPVPSESSSGNTTTSGNDSATDSGGQVPDDQPNSGDQRSAISGSNLHRLVS